MSGQRHSVWTATTSDILAKVKRARKKLLTED